MTEPFLHDFESKQYRRLRSWYLARLRRARFTDFDSGLLNPSRLLEADERNLEGYSKPTAMSKNSDAHRISQLAHRILLRAEWSALIAGTTGLIACISIDLLIIKSPAAQSIAFLVILTLVLWTGAKCFNIWRMRELIQLHPSKTSAGTMKNHTECSSHNLPGSNNEESH